MPNRLQSYIAITLISILVLSSLSSGYGQCIETLRTARTVYDEGRLHELEGILQSCLDDKKGFNSEERTEAYRLLILSYIYQDQPDLADDAMLKLLRANPRFKPDPNTDPNELINLYNTFRTDPIYRFGFKLGGNYSLVNVRESYSINSAFDTNGKFNSNVSIGFALFIERDFFQKRFTFRAEPTFSLYKSTYNSTGFPIETSQDTTTVNWEYVETQTWVGLNLLTRYRILKKMTLSKKKGTTVGDRLNPNIIFGPSIQYLLSSVSSNTTNVQGGESASGADLDYLELEVRETINLSIEAGIGFIFSSRKYATTVDLTYRYGLTNITDKNHAPDLSYRYGRAMSDLNMNTINISVGFMLNKYDPKKLTN